MTNSVLWDLDLRQNCSNYFQFFFAANRCTQVVWPPRYLVWHHRRRRHQQQQEQEQQQNPVDYTQSSMAAAIVANPMAAAAGYRRHWQSLSPMLNQNEILATAWTWP